MTTYRVRTPTLSQTCDQLEDATRAGRDLLNHPGMAGALGPDSGDPELASALTRFTQRWSWELRRLITQTGDLARRTRAAAGLYEEVERDTTARWIDPGRQIGPRTDRASGR